MSTPDERDIMRCSYEHRQNASTWKISSKLNLTKDVKMTIIKNISQILVGENKVLMVRYGKLTNRAKNHHA